MLNFFNSIGLFYNNNDKKSKKRKVDSSKNVLLYNEGNIVSQKPESHIGLRNLVLKEQEDTYYEFEIIYDLIEIKINFFLTRKDSLLVITDIDIEGPGPRKLGRRIFSFKKDVCSEL